MPETYQWRGVSPDAPVALTEDESLVIHFEPGTDLLADIGEGVADQIQDLFDIEMYLRSPGLLRLAVKDVTASSPAPGPVLDKLLQIGVDGSPALRRESGMVFEATGVPVHTTGRLYVRFAASVGRAAAMAVLETLGAGGWITSWTARRPASALVFGLQAADSRVPSLFKVADAVEKRSDVAHCYPYVAIANTLDGPCPREWHLRRSPFSHSGYLGGAQPDVVSSGLEAVAAWRYARGDTPIWIYWFPVFGWLRRFRSLFRFRWFWRRRIRVAIIDGGIDIEHTAFKGFRKVRGPGNTVGDGGEVDDPQPPEGSSENHGTPMAGLAVANGGAGAHGVAPRAALIPIRSVESGPGLEEERLADGFDHAFEHGADVISCSWHWEGSTVPTVLATAIGSATGAGRNGKGCVVLFSAGNRRIGVFESIDANETAQISEVIPVGACTPAVDMVAVPSLIHPDSVGGSALWCLFPVTSPGYPPLYLVDRMGTDGRNSAVPPAGDYYEETVGSTSQACAGAAGVAALILSANRALSRDEVKTIMADCCEKIPTSWDSEVPLGDNGLAADSDYGDSTGHGPTCGHGRLNALRAVQMARGECEELSV